MPSEHPSRRSPSATPADGLPVRRLDHALDSGIGDPAQGPARRAEHTALIEDWLREQWEAAVPPTRGVALAAVGSVGRRDAGPASDLDLVLHSVDEARDGARGCRGGGVDDRPGR